METLGRIAGLAEAAMERLAWVLSAVAALSVAGIIAILVFSSVQRYILVHPIPETEELAAFLFVALAFLSIAEGFVSNRQIRILMLWRKLPPSVQGWAMILGHLLTIAVLALLILQLFDFAWLSFQFKSRSYVADMLMWPWMMIMPVALFVLALAAATRVLVDLHAVLSGRPVPEALVRDTMEPE